MPELRVAPPPAAATDAVQSPLRPAGPGVAAAVDERRGGATALEGAVADALARLPPCGEAAAAPPPCGASLVSDGREAFVVRALAARAAGRRLDLQYYAWHGDVTGMLLAREVLMAADRGVRVRMLLDDVFALGRERALAALDSHPLIQVRLFNGTRWRAFGRFGFALEMLLGGWHLNRRMHNKSWIADGCLAIAGGRNLGDAYFDAAEDFNFRDLDLVLAGEGPARSARAIFDRYWGSALARRAGELSAAQSAEGGLPALRRALEAAAARPAARAFLDRVAPQEEAAAALREHLARRLVPIADAGAVQLVADPPAKARRGLAARRLARVAGGLGPEVAEALRGARRAALLISPYFVPGKAGVALLRELTGRGVRVAVVTNSLAATDVVAVHGGYARYRRALLRAGVAMFELKPSLEGVLAAGGAGPEERGSVLGSRGAAAGPDEKASLLGSRGASLHTKAFVVDDGPICVGSFNMDPRSAALNTEMAVFADHPALAAALRGEHARLAEPGRSWRVTLHGGHRLCWEDCGPDGRPRRAFSEPEASWGRRLVAALTRLLPVERHL